MSTHCVRVCFCVYYHPPPPVPFHYKDIVLTAECLGKVFYITKRPIYPGEELLVYYGKSYAEVLGINVTQFDPRQAVTMEDRLSSIEIRKCGA